MMYSLKITYSIFVFLLLNIILVEAQPFSRYTQFSGHNGIINPAALSQDYLNSGGEYSLSLGLSYRNKIVNDGLSIHSYLLKGVGIKKLNRSVYLLLGGHLYADEVGPSKFGNAYGRAGISLSPNPVYGAITLAFDFGLDWFSQKVNPVDQVFFDAEDPLANYRQSVSSGNGGFGLFYNKTFEKKNEFQEKVGPATGFYFGVSIPRIKRLNLILDRGGDLFFQDAFNLKNYFVLAGLNIPLNSTSILEPSIWYKRWDDFENKHHVDINLIYRMAMKNEGNDRSFSTNYSWLGLGFASNNTIHFEGGISPFKKPWKLGLGYSIQKIPGSLTTHALELNMGVAL